MCVRWIDEFAEIEIDGPVVHVVGYSEGERQAIRAKRSVFRAYIERAKRLLDAADREDQGRIAKMRGPG